MLTESATLGFAVDLSLLRKWYARGKNELILEALEGAARPHSPDALFYAVATLINLSREEEAARYLEEGLSRAEGTTRADLLALQAFLLARRGDFAAYLKGAREAAQAAPTPLSLYHLGLALPEPQEGLKALQAALLAAEESQDAFAKTRNAFALAVPLLRLGRYREALHWIRYAEVRCEQPNLRVALLHTRACVQILHGGAWEVEAELRRALTEVETYPWAEEPLATTLADYLQAEGGYEEALDLYSRYLKDVPRSNWPRLVHGIVRALVALGRGQEAQRLAETALTVAQEFNRAEAQLALGVALWPAPSATVHLRQAFESFQKRAAPYAAEAALHLAALLLQEGDELQARTMLEQAQPGFGELGDEGLRLLGGRALTALEPLMARDPSLRVHLLDSATVYQEGRALRLRPRGLEIIALLLSHPRGLSGEALTEALYGGARPEALRVELYRLRKGLGDIITTRPYRLSKPVRADFVQVQHYLKHGRLKDAVALYRGPLLPGSSAPGIVALNKGLEAELQGAVVASHDPEIMWTLAQVMTDDLELWETVLSLLPEHDPRYVTASGRVARLRYELDL